MGWCSDGSKKEKQGIEMKPKDRASSADIQLIQSNPDARPRDLAKQLNLKQSVVTYWLKFVKPKKLTNKPKAKRIKHISSKMKDRLEKYKLAKATYNVANCEVCGNTENLSIHHIAGRSGKLLYDHANFLQVCMAGSTYLNEKYPESNQTEGCHPWIERNLKLARELGYSKSKIKNHE
jgi:Mn-dependent DtxR family transcriptional regulator